MFGEGERWPGSERHIKALAADSVERGFYRKVKGD